MQLFSRLCFCFLSELLTARGSWPLRITLRGGIFSVPFPTSAPEVMERIPICCNKKGFSVTDQCQLPQIPFLFIGLGKILGNSKKTGGGDVNPEENCRPELQEEITWSGIVLGTTLAWVAHGRMAMGESRQTRSCRQTQETGLRLEGRCGLLCPRHRVWGLSAHRDTPRKEF